MGVGQMIGQLLAGLPATSAMPAISPVTAVQEDEREASAFAGLLQIMSAKPTAGPSGGTLQVKVLSAGNSDTLEAEPAPAQTGATPDSMAMLLVMATTGNNVTSPSPAVENPSPEQPDISKHRENGNPQNVVWSLAGTQVFAAQRINGRMPESTAMVADATLQTTGIADGGESPEGHAAVTPETIGASRMNTATTQSPAVSGMVSDAYNQPAPARRQNVAEQDASRTILRETPALKNLVQPVPETNSQTTATSTGSGRANATAEGQTANQIPDVAVRTATVAPEPPLPQKMVMAEEAKTAEVIVAKQPETPVSQGLGQPAPDTKAQTTATPSGNNAANTAANTAAAGQAAAPLPAVHATAAAPEPPQSPRMFTTEAVTTSEDAVVKQPEAPAWKNPVQPVPKTDSPTTVTSSGNSVANITPVGQATSPLPLVEGVAHDAQVALAVRLPVDGNHNELQAVQEPRTSKPEADEGVEKVESRMSGNAVAGALKKTPAPFSGEFSGRDGDSASGQKTGVQDNMALLHQMKVASTPVAASTSGPPAGEPVRTNVMTQVVNQVSDHLAGRDIKSGAEQVVIRLSPENLGELKLDLRMENHCLKVSIVAENDQVRDSLIKHSDMLKETLARQNITMESFDVSTGSNGSGAFLHDQSRSGWQELAQQQRNTAWNTAKGYRIDDTPEMAQRPLYQASAEYSMVDVRF